MEPVTNRVSGMSDNLNFKSQNRNLVLVHTYQSFDSSSAGGKTAMTVQTQKHCQGTLRELCAEHELVKNLVFVSLIWAITSFSFYQILFKLKTLPGDIFVNSSSSSIANASGHFFALPIYRCMPVKRAMAFFFAIMLVGSLPLMLQFWQNEFYETYIVPLCILLCTFGAAGQFCNIYIAHLDLFPLVFSVTTMGFCNIVARSVTIFAPILAEIPFPWPAILFTSISVAGIILSCFVRDKV